MVFHDLYGSDIVMAYAVGGYAILPAKHIRAFDIELVYVLALILDFAAVGNINARHAFQDIANRAVLLLGEATYIICDGIALLPYAVGLDSHFFERY